MVVPKVPNDAWDAKLQGIKGHNETSISYVMSRTQRNKRVLEIINTLCAM